MSAYCQNGRTPLHRASFWGHSETCGVLHAAGADINTQDKVSQMTAEERTTPQTLIGENNDISYQMQ